MFRKRPALCREKNRNKIHVNRKNNKTIVVNKSSHTSLHTIAECARTLTIGVRDNIRVNNKRGGLHP